MSRNLLVLAVLAVTGAVYAQVGDFDFVAMDDRNYVVENPRVTTGLEPANLGWAFTTLHASNWHPLTWISHMADCEVFGLDAGAHHRVNLLFHLANTLLVFLVLDRLTGDSSRSVLVAALFALHPLHVESVAWVSERKDLLSAFFGLGSLYLYALYARKGGALRYALVVLGLALSLMSKPMLVTFPILLLLLDAWPLGRRALAEKVPFVALAAASCVVTIVAQSAGGAVASLERFSFAARLGNAAVSYVGYLVKAFVPVKLSVFYPHPGETLSPWAVAGSVLFVVGVTVWVVRARRDRPWLAVGWLWYLVSLVPVVGLVQVGQQAMADRYTYLPLLGPFLMIAWGLPLAAKRGWLVRAPVLVVLLGLAVLTHARVSDWRDSRSLFEAGLRVNPRDYVSHANLGYALQSEGEIEEAVTHYRKAIEINPRLVEPRNNLGLALAERGHLDEAMTQYRAVLSVDPDDLDARNNLGGALAALERFEEAAREFEAAVRIAPDHARSHYNLGTVLARRGRTEEAIESYRRSIELDPGNGRAYNNLASAMNQLGRLDEAAELYREALRIDPDHAFAHKNLGVVLGSLGRLDEAAVHFRRAVEIDPSYASARQDLARVLLALDDPAGAWTQVHALRELGIRPDPAFVSRLSARMPDPRP